MSLIYDLRMLSVAETMQHQTLQWLVKNYLGKM